MNYRHSFHAGNFADLVKHAALLAVLNRLVERPEPLLVIDTHAGAGLYDLTAADAVRSREAQAGVARLLGADLPPPMRRLASAVARRNPGGRIATYPGSPALVLDLLRPQDSFVACELRPDDHGRLQALAARTGRAAQVLNGDGFDTLAECARRRPERLFALIDPPFERADDYARVAETVGEVMAIMLNTVVLIWLPLKDLETFDGFLRRLEAAGTRDALVAETRLRPLHDPMRMNGCALVAINAPTEAEADIAAATAFVAECLGEAGGRAKIWRLAG